MRLQSVNCRQLEACRRRIFFSYPWFCSIRLAGTILYWKSKNISWKKEGAGRIPPPFVLYLLVHAIANIINAGGIHLTKSIHVVWRCFVCICMPLDGWMGKNIKSDGY